MTASTPPPLPATRGTAAFYLERATRASHLLALLLVTAVSVRFAVAAAHHALDATSANFEPRPTVISTAATASAPRPRSSGRAEIEPAPSAKSEGRSVRIALGVSAGPPRSEVYVSGQRVGNTPFLGDMACKVGQRLRVEVVPSEPAGVPLVYERICSPGILRIDGTDD